MEKFPIFKACFSATGEEVLATSTHSKVLYVYDMLAGKLIPVHQVRGKFSVEHIAYQPPSPHLSSFTITYFPPHRIIKNKCLILVFGKCCCVKITCLNENSELTLY